MSRAGRIRVLLLSIALISLALGVSPLSALQNGTKARSLFVNLEVLAPAVEGNHIPTEVSGGWPLTLRLSGNKDLGIGRSEFPPIFPVPGYKGFLVFEDPDGCHSWVLEPPPQTDPPPDPSLPWASPCPVPDETYVEFTPGENDHIALTTDRNPEINVWKFDPCPANSTCPGTGANTGLAPLGPPQGPVNSGYGLGRSGLLPGLVILADAGVGVVVDQQFERPNPVQARNLAGYIKSVSYELNDATSRTSIVAHMMVPPFLFVPNILADRAIGDCPGEPWKETWVRVDGGPIAKFTPGLNTLDRAVEGKIITIRAFVVNQNAPNVLEDMNGDGVVNAKDAAIAGLELLSSEVVIRIKNYYQPIELFGYFYDLDGNGCVGGIVAPTGAGDITRVPR